MTDEEYSIKMIELIEAVREDNLELVKEYVSFFNNNEITHHTTGNPFTNSRTVYDVLLDNDSGLYVLDNLQSIPIKVKKIAQWAFEKKQATDNNRIIPFIQEYLDLKLEGLELNQISDLIELSILMNRYDLLEQIKLTLQEKGE